MTTTVINGTFSYKGVTGAKSSPPLKKAHSVQDKIFVVIDESLVKSLGIDGNDTWFEQIQTENGILLRLRPFTPANRDEV